MSNDYLRDALFSLNRETNAADSFELKHFYRAYIYSLIDGVRNIGADLDLPDSLLKKYVLYDSFLDKNYYKEVLLSYRANRDFYKAFGRLSYTIEDYYSEEPYRYIEELSFNDSIDMVRGFFDHYDKDISRHLDDLLDDNLIREFLPDTEDAIDYEGFTYPIPGGKNLIIAQNKGDISTSGTLAHEVIHSYLFLGDTDLTYEKDIRKSVNGLDETYPRFIELAFMKYLESIGFNRTDISSYIKNYNSTFSEFLFVFNDVIADKESKIFSDNLDLFLNARDYSLPTALAYHYLDKYLDSPYIVKSDLLSLNQESKYRDLPYLLDNFGLQRKDLVKPKVLVKSMSNFDIAA